MSRTIYISPSDEMAEYGQLWVGSNIEQATRKQRKVELRIWLKHQPKTKRRFFRRDITTDAYVVGRAEFVSHYTTAIGSSAHTFSVRDTFLSEQDALRAARDKASSIWDSTQAEFSCIEQFTEHGTHAGLEEGSIAWAMRVLEQGHETCCELI